MAGSEVESTVASRFSMNRPQATMSGMSFRAGINSELSYRAAGRGVRVGGKCTLILKGHTTNAAVACYTDLERAAGTRGFRVLASRASPPTRSLPSGRAAMLQSAIGLYIPDSRRECFEVLWYYDTTSKHSFCETNPIELITGVQSLDWVCTVTGGKGLLVIDPFRDFRVLTQAALPEARPGEPAANRVRNPRSGL